MPSYDQKDLGGGIDRRYGAYGRKARNNFYDLDNYYTDAGGKLNRRPPLKSGGTFDANSYGLFPINGALYALAARGASPLLPAGVTALPFDIPFGASAHRLVDIVTLGDTPVALIAHTIAGALRYFLHVFDNAADQPTYVLDPAFPWMHEISPTVSPVMTVATSKVWISDKYGDVYHCAVNRPRVWNTLSRDQIVARGHEVDVYCTAAGSATFTIPLDFAQLFNVPYAMKGFLAWFVESYTGTGKPDYTLDANWGTRLTETSGAPGAGQCQFASTANVGPTPTYTNWITVTINATAAGWFRVRFITPRDGITQEVMNYVTSGAWGPRTVGGATTYYFQGDGTAKLFIIEGSRYYAGTFALTVDGAVKASPADYTIGSDASGQILVTMVAAPGASALVGLSQSATDASHRWIGPGTVRTWGGDSKWIGGEGPFSGAGGYHHYFLALDAKGIPTSVVEKAPGDFISGKFLYESVYLGTVQFTGFSTFTTPVYTGGSFTSDTGLDPTKLYVTRTTAADGALYGALGALFGVADAGFIPASKDDLSGGPVTMLGATRDRLLVSYARGCEMWSVFTDSTQDAIADTTPIGTDGQASPHAIDFFGAVMMPTSRGLRALDLGRRLFQTIDDQNIGSPVDGLGTFAFQSACFWPVLSHYVAGGTIGGAFCFLVLSYHPQERVAAWSRYPAPIGVTGVDFKTMVAIGQRLYFRNGTSLFYFDASAALGTVGAFKDVNDGATAFQSAAEPLLNDLGNPGRVKRYLRWRMAQTGKSTVSFKRMSGKVPVYQPGPTIDGDSSNTPGCRLAMRAPAVAPRIVSTDTRGHRLEFISYDFEELGHS